MYYSIPETNFTYRTNWHSSLITSDNHNYFKHLFYVLNNKGYYIIDERNRS